MKNRIVSANSGALTIARIGSGNSERLSRGNGTSVIGANSDAESCILDRLIQLAMKSSRQHHRPSNAIYSVMRAIIAFFADEADAACSPTASARAGLVMQQEIAVS